MVIDTSAILAILLNEPDAKRFSDVIEASGIRLISAITLLEAAIVLESRKGAAGRNQLEIFAEELDLKVVPFDESHAESAREIYARFGKGNHKAGLNIIDCCAYALAASEDEPLLYKGGDFALTAVKSAL